MADKTSEVIASTAVNYRIKRSVLNNSRAKKVTLSLKLSLNKTYLSFFKPLIDSTIYNVKTLYIVTTLL